MFSLFFSFVFTYSPRLDLKKNTFLILPRTIFSWNTNTRKTLVFFHWPASMAKVRDEVNFWCVLLLFLFFLPFFFSFLMVAVTFLVQQWTEHRSAITDHRSAILENHCSVFGYRSAISENHCSVFGYRSPIRPKWHRSQNINRSAILPIPIPIHKRGQPAFSKILRDAAWPILSTSNPQTGQRCASPCSLWRKSRNVEVSCKRTIQQSLTPFMSKGKTISLISFRLLVSHIARKTCFRRWLKWSNHWNPISTSLCALLWWTTWTTWLPPAER